MSERLPALITVANGILAAAGGISLLVFCSLVYRYGWTGERVFSSLVGTLLYYALPAILAILFFAFLRLPAAYKTPLAILCAVVIVLVYGFEVGLYLTNPERLTLSDEIARLRKSGVLEPEPRDTIEKIADLRGKGIDAVGSVITPIVRSRTTRIDGGVPANQVGHTELMPLGGIARRPTVVCSDSGTWHVFESDEHGFHNPLGMWQPGLVDIAAVGNSWTYGWCVPSDRNFVALLRRRAPATLNLGMAGEGPLQILAIAKEYLAFLRPPLVLWFYYEGNNLLELQDEKRHPLLLRYLEDDFSQGLERRQREIDQALIDYTERRAAQDRETRVVRDAKVAAYVPQLREVMKLTTLRQRLGLVYGTTSQEQETRADLTGPTMDLFSEILSHLKNRVSAWGGTVVFIYLPSRERFATSGLGAASQQRTGILRMVNQYDIPLIDLLPAFQAHRDPLSLFPFRKGEHYNDEGHRLVAEELLADLTSPSSSAGLRSRIRQ